MKNIFKITLFSAGFLSAHFLFNSLPQFKWKHRVFEKSEIVSLISTRQSKEVEPIAVVSNCVLGHYDTHNELDKALTIRNRVAGLFSEIANILSAENHLNYDFINFSRTHFSPRDLTPILFHILQNTDIKTIVFNLDPNSIHFRQSTDLASTLEAYLTLQRVSKLYPDLSEKAQILINAIETDDTFKIAKSIYQNFLKFNNDSNLDLLPRYDIEGMNSYWLNEDLANIDEIQIKLNFLSAIDRIKLFKGLAQQIQYLIYLFAGGRTYELMRIKSDLKQEINLIEKSKNHPLLDAPILNAHNDQSKKIINIEIYLTWLEIYFEIAKRKNKQFVYYFTPSIEATPNSNEEVYSLYTKPITNLVESYGFKVYDLSKSHILKSSDLIARASLITYSQLEENSTSFKLFRQPNVSGKLKLAKALIEFLEGNPLQNNIHPLANSSHSAFEQIRFIDAETLVEFERQSIYSLWALSLEDEYLPYFTANKISPTDYFNQEIFKKIKETEISWLNGQGQLAFTCARVNSGCGPSWHLKKDVFQKLSEF